MKHYFQNMGILLVATSLKKKSLPPVATITVYLCSEKTGTPKPPSLVQNETKYYLHVPEAKMSKDK